MLSCWDANAGSSAVTKMRSEMAWREKRNTMKVYRGVVDKLCARETLGSNEDLPVHREKIASELKQEQLARTG